MLPNRVFKAISERGPLSGAELHAALGGDPFALWKSCYSDESLIVTAIGRKYLRIDGRFPSGARLSPSILREFLAYSVVSLESQRESALAKAREMRARFADISERKKRIAESAVARVIIAVAESYGKASSTSFVLAGDVVYCMAHDDPRSARGSNRAVLGSDIDIIAVTEDGAPDAYVEALERAIREENARLIENSMAGQEIDFVVKRFSKVREQAAFDSLKRMAACKALRESVLLDGDERIFSEVKTLLDRSGAAERLRALEARALEEREEAISRLLEEDRLGERDGLMEYFYSSEESSGME